MRSAIGIVHLLNRDYKDVDSEDDSTVTVHIQEALQNFWILKGSGDEFKLVGGALSSIAKLHVVISTCISWYSMVWDPDQLTLRIIIHWHDPRLKVTYY